MTGLAHGLGGVELVSLAPNLSRTSSSNGSFVDLSAYEGIVGLVVDAGAATAGSSPTLDVTLDESEDGSTGITAVPASAYVEATNPDRVTNAAQLIFRRFDKGGRKAKVRAAWAIGGTSTPTFPFGVFLVVRKKYR